MCQLTIDQLPDDERADVAKARALLDPYVLITAVDWTQTEETA